MEISVVLSFAGAVVKYGGFGVGGSVSSPEVVPSPLVLEAVSSPSAFRAITSKE